MARSWRRLYTTAWFAAPAILAYTAVRAVGLTVFWYWCEAEGLDMRHYLTQRYDSGWYVGILTRGYDGEIPTVPEGQMARSNLAFFPLYPALIRVVSAILPVQFPTAGWLISMAASLLAAWGIFMVGNQVYGRRAGILLAALWGVMPHAIVESMAYTEPVFTAIAAWALYALLNRRWIIAGSLCLLAGLTRPTALALIAAVGVAGCWAVLRRQDSWRPFVGMALAPLGWLGYIGWVGHRLGRVDGYFKVQDEWGTSFDGGVYTVGRMGELITQRGFPVVMFMVTLVLLASVLLVVVAHRQPLPLLVYSATMVIIAVGSAGFYHSKARYLLPAFTLLLPIAAGAARMRTRTVVATLVFVALISGWFGGFLSLVWIYSP